MRYGKGQTEQLENILQKLRALEQNQPQQSQQPQIKIEYRDRIVEKPIYIEKPIYKGEKIVEKIVEKPIEKIVEKQVFVWEEDWLPEYWPFPNMQEYKNWLGDVDA
jgi:hypothetical protein